MLRLLCDPRQPPQAGVALLALLQRLPWPGNLHQLSHALQVAVRLAGDAPVLLPEHLPPALLEEARQQLVSSHPEVPAPATLQEVEMASVQAALEQAHGNVSEAARRLGVSRNTVYRKLRNTGRSC
jgi:transcriptional regulator of acetoin/glycerol metabolism